jgi:tRNA modification GTPase
MRVLTPPGTAGVACFAFAPGERAALLTHLRSGGGGPFALRPAGLQRAELWLDGRCVDDVLVVDRAADGIELHTHGAMALLDALVEAFGEPDADAPSPAERLRRTALSPAQLDLALEQRGVDWPAFVAGLKALEPAARAEAVTAALARSRVALALAEPQRLVLVGAQNAGKSTLFNALLGRERALVGEVPGLTRDPVVEVTTLSGYPYELVDTAGHGEFAAELDARAYRLGASRRTGATILLVVDGSRRPGAEDQALLAEFGDRVLVAATKADLPAATWPTGWPTPLRVAAHGEAGFELRRRVGELLRARRGLPPGGAVGGPAALDGESLARLSALRDAE